jgi:hypothetical protein
MILIGQRVFVIHITSTIIQTIWLLSHQPDRLSTTVLLDLENID